MSSIIKTIRLPQELLHSITGSLADAITIYAKKAGVTITITTGAGPVAVSAIGDAVTFSDVVVGVTTVTQLQAAITASASVDALIGVSGTGATIFSATYAGLAVTKLYADYSLDVHGIAGRTPSGKFVPFRVTDDGQLEVAVTIGDEMKTHAWVPVAGAAATEVVGVNALLPEAKTTTFDTTMVGTYTPKQNGVTVTTVAGGGHSVAVTGKAITVTVQVGVTTKANLDADWAASAAALALATFSVTAGTVAAGYVGEVLSLWTSRTVYAGADLGLTAAGSYIPKTVDDEGHTKTAAMLPVSGAAPTAASGVTTNIPEAKSTTMDVGETMTFTPLVDGVRVITATGAARALSVIGRDIYVTVIAAATTDTQVIADWAANATATALGTPTGTGGTFAAGYVGETLSLWTARTTSAAAGMVLRSDGTYGPEEADALTGATKVYQRGMNVAVDAQQTMPVVPPPEAVQGPSPLIEVAAQAEVAGSVDIPIPVSNYKFFSLTAKWTATAGDTYQWDVLARLDQGAAPGDLVNINDRFLPAGALGAAALSGSIFVNNPNPFKAWEMVLRRTKVNNNGPAALYCRFAESR